MYSPRDFTRFAAPAIQTGRSAPGSQIQQQILERQTAMEAHAAAEEYDRAAAVRDSIALLQIRRRHTELAMQRVHLKVGALPQGLWGFCVNGSLVPQAHPAHYNTLRGPSLGTAHTQLKVNAFPVVRFVLAKEAAHIVSRIS